MGLSRAAPPVDGAKAASTARRGDRVDGVAAMWHRVDAIDATTPRLRRVLSYGRVDAVAAKWAH